MIHTYYLPTFFREKDPNDTTCTLFIRKYKQYKTSTGKDALVFCSDVVRYPDEHAMVEAIKTQDMKELPAEAETSPRYVPEELKTSYMRQVQSV